LTLSATTETEATGTATTGAGVVVTPSSAMTVAKRKTLAKIVFIILSVEENLRLQFVECCQNTHLKSCTRFLASIFKVVSQTEFLLKNFFKFYRRHHS